MRGRLRLSVAALALAACSAGADGPAPGEPAHLPRTEPFIRGVVTAVLPEEVRVEENPRDAAGSAKAVLRLTRETRLLRRSGAPAHRSDLRTGIRVSAWTTGPIMESYPVQGTAGILVIEADTAGREPLPERTGA